MESESDYEDEIQSPDEDEGEIKANSNDGDEEMDVDAEDDANAVSNNVTSKGIEGGSAENEEMRAHLLENDDNSLLDGSQMRSPSIAHSNISEDNAVEDVTGRITPESKVLVGKTSTNESQSHDSNGEHPEDSEDSEKGMNDDDKYSSYRSSPPISPSPPRSPDDGYDKVGGEENLNHAGCGNRSPKQSLDDQVGELDFEEELPERKEDCDSVGELSKAEKNANGCGNEDNDGKARGKGEEKVEKKKQNENIDNADDDDDDGEVEDDEDLEEGEVKDGSAVRKVLQRPMCRFFAKGQCTWGTNCRFLHPGVNDKGNYNMFAPPKPLVPSNGPGLIGPGFGWHGGGSRISPPFHGRGFAEPVLPPPPPTFDEPAYESAWERGLRHAKEILKKSSKRKEMEPDFEEKRMNLGLGGGEGSNEYEKENDYYSRSPYRSSADPFDPYCYEEAALDPYERQAHDYWRGGNYENFEVRYTRTDYDYRDHDRLRERERIDRARDREREQIFRERERERDSRSRRDKFERPQHSPERNWRDERYIDPQIPPRARGDEWRDPWRRSTSPKRRNLSRSFSSHSSASYSSSRSSGSGSSSYSSRSRSSSGSSHSSYSSRSYTHSRSSHSKLVKNKTFAPAPGQGAPGSSLGTAVRKAKSQQPQPDHLPVSSKVPRASLEKRAAPMQAPPPAVPLVTPPPVVERKKVLEKTNQPMVPVPRTRSLSSSGSESMSSRSRSRIEKSFDAWPQRKKRKSSRSGSSYSRSSSISSLESVSSKSSLSSKSSADSELEVILQEPPKIDDKPKKEKKKMTVVDPAWKSSFERIRPGKTNTQTADFHVKSLINSPRTSKDPLKQSGQKTQIKLTLLNKDKVLSTQSALSVRKDATCGGDTRKPKQPQPVPPEKAENPKTIKGVNTPSTTATGKKRSLQHSPKQEVQVDTTTSTLKISSSSTSHNLVATNKSSAASLAAAAAAAQLKKSTSSRREELLKQLKAVEDAIARKRAKLA